MTRRTRIKVDPAEVVSLGLRPNWERARDFPPTAEDETLLPLCVKAARTRRIGVQHTRFSIGSNPGYPDLTLWGTRAMWRELKGSRGVVYRDQVDVVMALRAAGGDAGFWFPEDWHLGTVEAELDAIAPPAEFVQAAAAAEYRAAVASPARTVPAAGRRGGRLWPEGRAGCGCRLDPDGRVPKVHTCTSWSG